MVQPQKGVDSRETLHIQNLARSKIDNIAPDVIDEMRKEDGSIDVIGLPAIKDVNKMGHEQLLQVLQQCPASDFFGQGREQLNAQTVSLNKANYEVLKMIRKVKLELVEAIPE